jgi:hypothetical protein
MHTGMFWTNLIVLWTEIENKNTYRRFQHKFKQSSTQFQSRIWMPKSKFHVETLSPSSMFTSHNHVRCGISVRKSDRLMLLLWNLGHMMLVLDQTNVRLIQISKSNHKCNNQILLVNYHYPDRLNWCVSISSPSFRVHSYTINLSIRFSAVA